MFQTATNNSAVFTVYCKVSDIGKNVTRVGHCRKFGEVSCTECTGQGNELIPTVRMQTGNIVEGYFGSEFPAICNHCGLKSPDVNNFKEIFTFFGKTTPYGNIFKLVITIPIDIFCSNFVKYGRQEIGEILHYLPDEKISPDSPAVVTAQIMPKICQGQPPTMYSECSRFHPNWFTLAEL